MENEDRTEDQREWPDLSFENEGPGEGTIPGGNSTHETYGYRGLQKGAMSSEGGKECRESGTEELLTIRSLFPEDYTFPPDTTMDSRELSRKLEEIRQILAARNIEFGFIGDLPDRVIYRYIVNECIVHDAIAPSAAGGFSMVLDGCDGVCDSCFQKAYCETGRELLLEEEDFGGL